MQSRKPSIASRHAGMAEHVGQSRRAGGEWESMQVGRAEQAGRHGSAQQGGRQRRAEQAGRHDSARREAGMIVQAGRLGGQNRQA
jgi:hypothetical protein